MDHPSLPLEARCHVVKESVLDAGSEADGVWWIPSVVEGEVNTRVGIHRTEIPEAIRLVVRVVDRVGGRIAQAALFVVGRIDIESFHELVKTWHNCSR